MIDVGLMMASQWNRTLNREFVEPTGLSGAADDILQRIFLHRSSLLSQEKGTFKTTFQFMMKASLGADSSGSN